MKLSNAQRSALKALDIEADQYPHSPDLWVDNAARRPFLALEDAGFAEQTNGSFYDTAFAITTAGRAALEETGRD